jgi:hypothetical protein
VFHAAIWPCGYSLASADPLSACRAVAVTWAARPGAGGQRRRESHGALPSAHRTIASGCASAMTRLRGPALTWRPVLMDLTEMEPPARDRVTELFFGLMRDMSGTAERLPDGVTIRLTPGPVGEDAERALAKFQNRARRIVGGGELMYTRRLPSGKWQATVRDRSGQRHAHTDPPQGRGAEVGDRAGGAACAR